VGELIKMLKYKTENDNEENWEDPENDNEENWEDPENDNWIITDINGGIIK